MWTSPGPRPASRRIAPSPPSSTVVPSSTRFDWAGDHGGTSTWSGRRSDTAGQSALPGLARHSAAASIRDQAAPPCLGDRFEPRVDAERSQEAADVVAYRLGLDPERLRDLHGRLPEREMVEHFELAGSHVVATP